MLPSSNKEEEAGEHLQHLELQPEFLHTQLEAVLSELSKVAAQCVFQELPCQALQ